jgi:hypothetical protein
LAPGFAETLEEIDLLEHGVSFAAIDAVEAAWGHIDMNFYGSGAFVVRLHDRRSLRRSSLYNRNAVVSERRSDK